MIMLCSAGSVSEYDLLYYSGTKIALGLMCSTSNNSLGVLSDIARLAEIFVYLNFRYLVVVFYQLDHPLNRRLEC
jgi:hypothetical protein